LKGEPLVCDAISIFERFDLRPIDVNCFHGFRETSEPGDDSAKRRDRRELIDD